MSLIIGIDPGKTIGLCVYDTDARRVLKAACVVSPQTALEWVQAEYRANDGMTPVAIERPRIYQSAGNELCDTIEQVGWMLGELKGAYPPNELGPGIYGCGSGGIICANVMCCFRNC